MMQDKEFTKDRPCSKVDIWNCFYGDGATTFTFPSSNVIRARSIIGRNVPRRLVLEGKAKYHEYDGEFRITLTQEGVTWLRQGTLRYLINHPERATEAQNLPGRWRRKINMKSVSKS